MKKCSKKKLFQNMGKILAFVLVVVGLVVSSTSVYADDPSYTFRGWQNITNQWSSGNMNASNSVYYEGQAIPFRLKIVGDHTSGTQDVYIQYDFRSNSSGHPYFFDYLCTYPSGYTTILSNDSGPSWSSLSATAPIPVAAGSPTGANGQVFNYTPVSGVSGLTIQSGSDAPHFNGTIQSDDSNRTIHIKYNLAEYTESGPWWNRTVTNPTGWIVWGGHLASGVDWGTGRGASSYPGDSGHINVAQGCGGDTTIQAYCAGISNPTYTWIFKQSGASSDYSGFILTVDSTNNYSVTDLGISGVSFNWASGTTHNFSYANTAVVTALQKQYIWTSTTATSPATNTRTGSFIVGSSGGTVTGYYGTQYYLTMATSPGTVTPSTSPANGWYNANASVGISTNDISNQIPDQSRYKFNNWTTSGAGANNTVNPNANSTSITMDNYKTLTANYLTQYYLTMATSPGTVTPSTSPANGWYNANASVGISTNDISNQIDGQSRYKFDNWTTSGAGANNTVNANANSTSITMDNYKTLTANYLTQYYLTMATSPGTVTPSTSPANGWYNANASVGISTNDISNEIASQSRYKFNNWTTSGAGANNTVNPNANSTSITMDNYKTLTANYLTQYYLTMATSPGGVTPSTSPANGWYNANASVGISTNDISNEIASQSRYKFNNWTTSGAGVDNTVNANANSTSITMDNYKTLTANYLTQYYLTMATNVGTVAPGNGWYNSGTTVPISANAGSPDYLWNGWTGTQTGTLNLAGYSGINNPASVTMNEATTETASWTFSPPPAPAGSLRYLPPGQLVVTVDVLGNFQSYPTSADGTLLVSFTQTSPDGSMTVEIPAGTVILNANGTPAYLNQDPDLFSIKSGTPTPPQGAQIVRAYELDPSGLNFKVHNAIIAAKYSPSDVPQGKTLTWAYFDDKAQKWVDMETAGYIAAGGAVPDAVACQTSHFTYFALIAK